jgi:hypothetical protein
MIAAVISLGREADRDGDPSSSRSVASAKLYDSHAEDGDTFRTGPPLRSVTAKALMADERTGLFLPAASSGRASTQAPHTRG